MYIKPLIEIVKFDIIMVDKYFCVIILVNN